MDSGLEMCPAFVLITLTSVMARGKDMAGRHQPGVQRRKLSQVGRNVMAGVAKLVHFNSSSENHLTLTSALPLIEQFSASFSSTGKRRVLSLQDGKSILKRLYYWK